MWTLNHKSSILTGKKPRYPSLDSAAMKALFILLIALTASCNPLKKMCKEEDPVQQLITNEASIQKKRHGLELVALNIPTDCKYGYYYLHYLSNCQMKIDEVRNLVVDVVESFISKANQSEHFSREITIDDLIVNFGFVEEDGSFHEPPSIAYAYLKNQQIHYCYYDNLFGKFISYEDVKELYQEAKNTAYQDR